MATIDDFNALDIRVGEIKEVEFFDKAKKPAYKLLVDFGTDIGLKKSSAQITECYQEKDLIGKQVLGVINFPPRQIADFMSEVLILGVYTKEGVILITPDKKVNLGNKLG